MVLNGVLVEKSQGGLGPPLENLTGITTPHTTTRRGAQEHFDATGHTYAIERVTQRVWDFSGGGYVHRRWRVIRTELPESVAEFERQRRGCARSLVLGHPGHLRVLAA